MSFWPPVYAGILCADRSARFGTVFTGEEDKTVRSQTRPIEITIGLNKIVFGRGCLAPHDLCDKFIDIHFASASGGHEGWPMRNFTVPMIYTRHHRIQGDRDK